MTYEIAFAVLAVAGVAGTARAVLMDGYRRTPTRRRAPRR